jgi:solute carrier family 66 (lysosomal lysine-arginine transporter), member 1
VVFSPQILENFQRSSAEGLSVQFIIVWLLGDVFNILGAVLQHVLPTMVILAVYYTLADFILLAQCFYCRGFTWRDEIPEPKKSRQTDRPTSSAIADEEAGERTALLSPTPFADRERRGSNWSANLTHLSPAVPLVSDVPPPPAARAPPSALKAVATNALAILTVCAAGVAGWWLSLGYQSKDSNNGGDSGGSDIVMDPWGQFFGWLCAVLYLGSRIPQLLLNWRRKSTEGVSMLFFLFACLGNLTYVLSIVAFDPGHQCGRPGKCAPGEAGRIYGQYILVNLSWLAGSAGTLLLDMLIFVQFYLYHKSDEDADDGDTDGEVTEFGDEEQSIEGDRWDQRPVLERNASR